MRIRPPIAQWRPKAAGRETPQPYGPVNRAPTAPSAEPKKEPKKEPKNQERRAKEGIKSTKAGSQATQAAFLPLPCSGVNPTKPNA